MKNKKNNAKKLFYKFLKEEGIWYLYWYNVLLGQKNNWNFTKIKTPGQYIFRAFAWSKSNILNLSDCRNNLDFWDDIDTKWRKIYEENK